MRAAGCVLRTPGCPEHRVRRPLLVVREGALAVPARGGSGKRRSTGACRRGVQQVVRANPDSTPLRRSSYGSARVASAAGPAEDQSAAFLVLPWTAAGKRAFRSELPAAFFEHSEQRNALHPKARAHVRDSWLLRTPLARSAVTTVRPCTRARAITNGSATGETPLVDFIVWLITPEW